MKDNELIAEFMGVGKHYEAQSSNQFNQYHKSWDWLMPVVEKIESFGYEFIIVESRCYVKHNTDHSVEELFHIETIGSKFDTTYDAVVQFINQLNNL